MIETIKKIDESIEILQKEIKEKQETIDTLNKSKISLARESNICLYCYGKGKIYKPCNDGDPYHKSSDDWICCSICNGTGKYNK